MYEIGWGIYGGGLFDIASISAEFEAFILSIISILGDNIKLHETNCNFNKCRE